MKLVHKRIEIIASLLVLLGILASLWVGYERISVEQNYKQVNMIIGDTDVKSFANGQKKPVSEILESLKAHHIEGVLFKEASLGSLVMSGDLEAFEGRNILSYRNAALLPANMPIDEANTYLLIDNREWLDNIRQYGLPKLPTMKLYDNGTYAVLVIPRMIPADDREKQLSRLGYEDIGVGFDQNWVEKVAQNGLAVIPQLRSWRNVDDASLRALKEEIRNLPNVQAIMFNDKAVPGYPKNIRSLAAILEDKEGNPVAPIVTIEFNDQKGMPQLATLLDKDVVRLHTISNAEMSKFTGDSILDEQKGRVEAIDRYNLAVKEREMRYLLIRFFHINEPGVSFKTNMQFLDDISNSLTQDGFVLDQPIGKLAMPQIPEPVTLLIGLAVAAGVVLLLSSLGFSKLAVGCGIVLYLGWAAGFFLVNETLALKAMAFISVVTFPSLSCIRLFPKEPLHNTLASIGRLLMVCAGSLIGAVLMVGLLSRTGFLLKLDYFSGVKLAHLLPILLVPFVLYIWEDPRPFETIKNIFNKALDYKWAILGGILVAGIAIYLMRTGNDGVKVSDSENFMRQFLTDYLGVRPRSKEFLIGYPASLVFFYYAGRRKPFWILSIPVIIGQVSLVNTYAHLHTPLLISLHRSFNGLLLGIIIGLIVLALVRLGQLLVHKLSEGGCSHA